jgi:hypothetical protein
MVLDSKKKLLSTPEIIAKATQSADLKGVPAYAALTGIIKELSLPNTEVKQFGNTVFIGHRNSKNNDQIVVRAINIDSAKNLIDNCEMYLKFLVNSGIKQMATFPIDSNEYTNIFKILQRKPFTKQFKFSYQTKNNKSMVGIEMEPK